MSFMGIEIARRGVGAHQSALETTGHNISNADNEHYSRQRVMLRSSDPLYKPALNRAERAGMIGQGVDVKSVERIRNSFVDDRIVSTSTKQDYWQTRQNYLYQLEKILNEPTDDSIRSSLDNLWAAWQEVSKFPEDIAHREVLIEKANALTARIRDSFSKMDNLRRQAEENVKTTVHEINSLGETIRALNTAILKSETMGDSPNDLYDKRDEAIEKLSGLVDINIGRSDKDELMVFVGQEILVQGDTLRPITMTPDGENLGFTALSWPDGSPVLPKSGRLQSLIELRDIDIKHYIEQLDLLAANLIDISNEIHRDGFGLSGLTNKDFFKVDNLGDNVNGNFDLNNDGTADVSAVFRVSGVNKLEAEKPVGIDGELTFIKNDGSDETVTVPYRADQTLEEVIDRINKSQSGVVAYLNHEGQLALKADLAGDTSKTGWKRNFMIRHLEDSGQLLVGYAGILNGSGPAGSFSMNRINDSGKFQSPSEQITFSPHFHPAAWIRLDESIAHNPTLVSAAQGTDVGGTGDLNTPNGSKDGTNALLIANALKHRNSMIGQSKNVHEFYNSVISKLGTESATAKGQTDTQDLLIKDLKSQRASISGVNLDEEMANMVKYQHGYNAAAKVISVMDEMIETLLSM